MSARYIIKYMVNKPYVTDKKFAIFMDLNNKKPQPIKRLGMCKNKDTKIALPLSSLYEIRNHQQAYL